MENLRVPVQIRVNKNGLDRIDSLAHSLRRDGMEGLTRTDIIRACLAVALSEPDKIIRHLQRVRETI